MQQHVELRKRRVRTAYALLAPVLALLFFVILLPELWSIFLSFTNYRLGRPLEIVGLENFGYLFDDDRFWSSMVITLVFVVASVAIQMVVGLLVSLLLAQRFRLQRLWIALIMAPIAVTPSVAGTIWRYLLDFNIGPLNYISQQLGLGRHPWLASDTLTLWVVIGVYVWQSVPYVFLFLYPARITFPETLYEAARIDGATSMQSFRHITMPLLRPVFLVALVFRTIFAFRTFGIIWNLTEGGPVGSTEILSIYLFREGFRYWRFGSAAAVAVIIMIFTLLVAGFQIRTMQKTMFGTGRGV